MTRKTTKSLLESALTILPACRPPGWHTPVPELDPFDEGYIAGDWYRDPPTEPGGPDLSSVVIELDAGCPHHPGACPTLQGIVPPLPDALPARYWKFDTEWVLSRGSCYLAVLPAPPPD